VLKLALDQSSVRVFLDTFVEIRAYRLRVVWGLGGHNSNLICHNLSGRERLRKWLGSRLVSVRRKPSSAAKDGWHREMSAKRALPKAKSGNVFGQPRRPAKMFCAGLYARVSTNDQQTLAMQNRAMREYAARRCWIIALLVREVNSGAAKRLPCERILGCGGSALASDPRTAKCVLFFR
jgi:hypothetical protein